MLSPHDLKVPGSIPGYTSDFSIRDPASPPCCEWYRTSVLEVYTEDYRDWGPMLNSMFYLPSTRGRHIRAWTCTCKCARPGLARVNFFLFFLINILNSHVIVLNFRKILI